MYKKIKRLLDFFVALALILISFPLQFFLFIGCTLSSRSFGIYNQERVGLNNRIFTLYKFKSMRDVEVNNDFQTSINDPRITTFGRFIRRTKLDEIPQLYNILKGSMSFVGPRPDVKGYAETLDIDLYYLDKVRPGITSPASIYFRDEEVILNKIEDKKSYNDELIWPLKAEMNRNYADNYSFLVDIKCLFQTVGILKSHKFNTDE